MSATDSVAKSALCKEKDTAKFDSARAFKKVVTLDYFMQLAMPTQTSTLRDNSINVGENVYYLEELGYDTGCNGAWCVEDHFKLMSLDKKKSLQVNCWHGLGFFGDVNNDDVLDFVNIEVDSEIPRGHSYIYEADTFKITLSTLDDKKFRFVPMKKTGQKKYEIKIAWKGYFFSSTQKDVVHIISQNWPHTIKF